MIYITALKIFIKFSIFINFFNKQCTFSNFGKGAFYLQMIFVGKRLYFVKDFCWQMIFVGKRLLNNNDFQMIMISKRK